MSEKLVLLCILMFVEIFFLKNIQMYGIVIHVLEKIITFACA